MFSIHTTMLNIYLVFQDIKHSPFFFKHTNSWQRKATSINSKTRHNVNNKGLPMKHQTQPIYLERRSSHLRPSFLVSMCWWSLVYGHLTPDQNVTKQSLVQPKDTNIRRVICNPWATPGACCFDGGEKEKRKHCPQVTRIKQKPSSSHPAQCNSWPELGLEGSSQQWQYNPDSNSERAARKCIQHYPEWPSAAGSQWCLLKYHEFNAPEFVSSRQDQAPTEL